MPLTMKNPAAAERHSGQLSDLLSTKWLPQIPPRLMAIIEGWGYDSLPDLSDRVFLVTGERGGGEPQGPSGGYRVCGSQSCSGGVHPATDSG